MMKLSRNIFLFLSVFCLCQTAIAKTFTLQFPNFGFHRQSCSVDIADVARTFGESAGVEILGSGCVAGDVGQYSAKGQIDYIASEPVETTTSNIQLSTREIGFYESFDECQRALSAEIVVFSEQTKLVPFISYCYRGNSVGTPYFRGRIDAVGKSEVKKYQATATWFGQVGNDVALLADLAKMIESKNGTVVASAIRPDIAGYGAGVQYYGLKEYFFHAEELQYWSTMTECFAAANGLKADWNHRSPDSIFYCTNARPGQPVRLLHVYISENLVSNSDFDLVNLSTTYSSRNLCVEDVSRVVGSLTRQGGQVLGTLCGQDEALKIWKMIIFFQPSSV